MNQKKSHKVSIGVPDGFSLLFNKITITYEADIKKQNNDISYFLNVEYEYSHTTGGTNGKNIRMFFDESGNFIKMY